MRPTKFEAFEQQFPTNKNTDDAMAKQQKKLVKTIF